MIREEIMIDWHFTLVNISRDTITVHVIMLYTSSDVVRGRGSQAFPDLCRQMRISEKSLLLSYTDWGA